MILNELLLELLLQAFICWGHLGGQCRKARLPLHIIPLADLIYLRFIIQTVSGSIDSFLLKVVQQGCHLFSVEGISCCPTLSLKQGNRWSLRRYIQLVVIICGVQKKRFTIATLLHENSDVTGLWIDSCRSSLYGRALPQILPVSKLRIERVL